MNYKVGNEISSVTIKLQATHHGEHISRWRIDLRAKIVMRVDDLLSDPAAVRS